MISFCYESQKSLVFYLIYEFFFTTKSIQSPEQSKNISIPEASVRIKVNPTD